MTTPAHLSNGGPAGFDLPKIETTELRASASIEHGAIVVRFSGTADTVAMPQVHSLLQRLHDEVLRAGAREVTIDLRALEFMNSSCFKAFVSWIGGVQELEEARQYKILFLSDPEKHWQRRSLGALSCFAVDLIRVES